MLYILSAMMMIALFFVRQVTREAEAVLVKSEVKNSIGGRILQSGSFAQFANLGSKIFNTDCVIAPFVKVAKR